MAEEQQEKRCPGRARQILRWIVCGLLVLLLLAAIIYQAPAKILTLLLGLLLACMFLPEAARKWFWLSAGAVFVAVAGWVFVPNRGEDWQPYTFADEIIALQAQGAIDDEENAATIYNELLEDYDPAAMKLTFLGPRLKIVTISEPWSSEAYPNLADWLQQHQGLIARLMEASQRKKCHLPLSFAVVVRNRRDLDRYPSLKNWATLLLRAGNNDIAEGRADQAVARYIAVLRMADHLYQQHKMVDFLIGFGIELIALPPLNRFVVEEQPNEEQLENVSQALSNLKNNWSVDFRRCLDFDRLFTKNAFCTLAYQTNRQGKVRLSRNPAAAIRYGFRRNIPQDYWQKTSTKASAMLAWWFLPSSPDKAARMIDGYCEKYYRMARADFDWAGVSAEPAPRFKLNCRFIVKSLTNSTTRLYRPFHNTYLRQLTLRRGSRLLVAIKQYQMEHSTWPADLDAIKSVVPAEALIDPVTANEFEYENHGQWFSLKGQATNIWPK